MHLVQKLKTVKLYLNVYHVSQDLVQLVQVLIALRNVLEVEQPHNHNLVINLNQIDRVRFILDISSLSFSNFGFLLVLQSGSLAHLEFSGETPLLRSHEALEDEIRHLRERLHTVESENLALNSKISQQQWQLEHRIAEIEMQMCGASSHSSIIDENDAEELERNRESII